MWVSQRIERVPSLKWMAVASSQLLWQVTDLLGIPANAEDAFVLNEIEHMCRRVEECEQDHREVRHG